ncbi:MAG: DUF6128 domain-containing protein [Lachnospiraceae bacterium]
MADYRRIVSYLYQYKNGKRGENVGFVRVQKAQDRLKIVLNIKDKKQIEDLMLRVYFYIHKNGKLYGIFVDNIVLREGSCEYKRAFLEREIFKNGEDIDDMHGMLLYYSREMSYGTEWDDKKIEVEQFILEQKKDDKIEKEKRRNDIKSDRNEINFLPTQTVTSKGLESATQRIREQMSEEVKKKIDKNVEKIEKKIDKKVEKIEKEIQNSGKISKSNLASKSNSASKLDSISKVDSISKSNSISKVNSKIKNSDKNKEIVEEVNKNTANTKKVISLKETEREKSREQEKNSQTKKTAISMIHMQESDERDERDEIELMFRDYPKIQDIDSEDLNDCVKIMPRDIGKMNTVNWWLRSNRLLLYRFEQYHYLLLGKQKKQDGSWQRVIGIPGIFDSKERYLASLFQFYCFIPTESKKYKTGSFGYWVTPIK